MSEIGFAPANVLLQRRREGDAHRAVMGICLLLSALLLLATWISAGGQAAQRTGGVGGGGVGAPAAFVLNRDDSDEDWWSIRCCTINVADRFRVAEMYAKALKQVKGLRADQVSVVNNDTGSTIYYGKYAREYDVATGDEKFKPDPLADLDRIRNLAVTINGQPAWPFLGATLESLPSTNQRYPDWEASKAKGYWSLQVAVFYDTKTMRGRKRAAEDYCKILRDEGHEAYYHHGMVNSSVIVGAFPKEAIQEVRRIDPMTGEATQIVNKVVDERLIALQRDKFKHNLENGHIIYQVFRNSATGEVTKEPNPSFPVQLPAAEAAAKAAPGPPKAQPAFKDRRPK